METTDSNRTLRVTGWEAAALALIAIIVRAGIFGCVVLRWHTSLQDYAAAGDGISYQAYARAITGDRGVMSEYDSRVFPGFPVVIAIVHAITRLPIPVSGLLVTWSCAGVATALGAMIFGRTTGYAMLVITSYWLGDSAVIMSEGPMLALSLTGIWLALQKKPVWAGLALGSACAIRPVGCFPLIAAVGAAMADRQYRNAGLIALASVLPMGMAFFLTWHLTGHVFQSARVYSQSQGAYAGPVLTWPFHALIATPMQVNVSNWRLAYIAVHVMVVLGGCFLLTRRDRFANQRELLAAIWLTGNTLFVLCIASGPYGWGFFHFPRFILCALPPLLFAYAPALFEKRRLWLALLPISFALAVAGVHHGLLDMGK